MRKIKNDYGKIGERDENGFWKIDKLNRIPKINVPADIEKLPWCNKKEKEKGMEYLSRLLKPKLEWGVLNNEMPKQSNIWYQMNVMCMANDPEGWVDYYTYYEKLTSLVTGLDGNDGIMQVTTSKKGIDASDKRDDPDVRRKVGNALLIVLAVTTELDDQYMLRMMLSTSTETTPDENGSYLMSGERVAMLHRPESSVWSDEERLVLQFTYAVMREEMTDDIWKRAEAAWGMKEPLRYIAWIGQYIYMNLFMAAMYRRQIW
ncbi:MAG: hypothetical protein HKP58_02250 [Desulfatitalea sp.]|nr:hypothetical protein [Desulfatitalea sp.]NNJ99210.1 hypothetical protein [Desulfatitalea sp.]